MIFVIPQRTSATITVNVRLDNPHFQSSRYPNDLYNGTQAMQLLLVVFCIMCPGPKSAVTKAKSIEDQAIGRVCRALAVAMYSDIDGVC